MSFFRVRATIGCDACNARRFALLQYVLNQFRPPRRSARLLAIASYPALLPRAAPASSSFPLPNRRPNILASLFAPRGGVARRARARRRAAAARDAARRRPTRRRRRPRVSPPARRRRRRRRSPPPPPPLRSPSTITVSAWNSAAVLSFTGTRCVVVRRYPNGAAWSVTSSTTFPRASVDAAAASDAHALVASSTASIALRSAPRSCSNAADAISAGGGRGGDDDDARSIAVGAGTIPAPRRGRDAGRRGRRPPTSRRRAPTTAPRPETRCARATTPPRPRGLRSRLNPRPRALPRRRA